jgi:hypothetical protein
LQTLHPLFFHLRNKGHLFLLLELVLLLALLKLLPDVLGVLCLFLLHLLSTLKELLLLSVKLSFHIEFSLE